MITFTHVPYRDILDRKKFIPIYSRNWMKINVRTKFMLRQNSTAITNQPAVVVVLSCLAIGIEKRAKYKIRSAAAPRNTPCIASWK